jgi:hypothetical protein
MTDTEVTERKALLMVFLQEQPLMCYFHVKKACKEKLRGNTEKEVILKDIGELHSMPTQAKFNMKFGVMFNHWLANSDNFAMYLYHQWVIGEFKEWQIYHSSPEVVTTNNLVESLNATLKKYFTCHKRFKLGKFFLLRDMFINRLCTVIKLSY